MFQFISTRELSACYCFRDNLNKATDKFLIFMQNTIGSPTGREPQMLMMATQMPRNKRAQKAFDPDGNPGKTKRIITLESDDDVVQDYEDDDEVEVQGHADKKSRPTGSDLDSDHHS
ncbi:hypothetical protein PSTG_18971, partial [Puccinia striiformis f. sp. tritici PST-78]